MEPALVARDVRKTYGETTALDGASLSIQEGEVLVLVGPNGAGKTTLVRTLTGTTEIDGGAVEVFGQPPAAVARDRLGVLPQSFSPPERLTAIELLEYYAGLYDTARDPERVLAEVGLEDAADTWYERLSGGQRRRACLGAAIVNEPDIVVLDEPTTGIDPAGRQTVRHQIDRLAASGSTVLVTTHDMGEAATIADRVAVLVDGAVTAVDSPDALIEQYGGSPRLSIECESPQSAVAAIESAVERTVTVVDETEPTNTVVVDEVKPSGISAIVAALDDAGIEYGSLRWQEPDLETVYMAVAGNRESARQSPAPPAGGDRQ